MTNPINILFRHDYDSDLYMLSKDFDAKDWKVIIHCIDGEKHIVQPDEFLPYPGTTEVRGEISWCIERFGAQKIEIQRPGLEPLIIAHPDFERISKKTEEKPPNLDQPKPKKAPSKRSTKKVKNIEKIFLAVVYGGEGKHTYRRWRGKNGAGWEDIPGEVYDIYLLNASKENLYQLSCEIPGGKVSIDQLHSQSYHQIDTLEDFQFDFINEYYVTYIKENGDQKYFLEFYLPKEAIFEKHWEDIPLLNQRGFMNTHVLRP